MKPARRTHVRFVLAALLLLGALQSSTPATAQQVGSACSPANKVIYPTYFAGTSQAYVCDGAHLVLLESDTAVPLQKGIGTATPQATLDVNGEVRVGNTGLACSATTVGAMRYNSVNLDVEYCNGTSWTGSGGAVSWSGLTSPTGPLALTMGSDTSTFTYGAATGATSLFKLTDTTGNTGTGYMLDVSTATGSAENPFHVGAGAINALTVLANGNVGIGTTSPSGNLHIYDDSASTTPVLDLGARAMTSPSSSGTFIAANAPSGFGGNLVDLQTNGTDEFAVNYRSDITGGTLVLKNLDANFIMGAGGDAFIEQAAEFSTFCMGIKDEYGNYVLGVDCSVPSLTTGTMGVGATFSPAANSTNTYYALAVNPTIVQSGTSTGITRALYVSPTLTTANDFRAIETTAYTYNILGTPPTTIQQVLWNAPTLAAASTTTVTNAATEVITGAPVAGSHVAITNPYALWVEGAAATSKFDGTINAKNITVTGTCTGCGGASWNAITNPIGPLALTMGANTSTFTYNATTGVNDLFTLADTTNNTGTGALLSLATATGSKASPLNVKTQGNQTLQINPAGSVVIGDLQGNTNDAIEQLEVVSGASGNQIKWGNPTANGGTLNGFLGFDGGSNTIDIVAQNGNMALYSGNSLNMYLDMHQNVGIGTATPTNRLSFSGQSAQEIWLERETTANTAGSALTVAAGGATSAATNKNGGNLILSGGTATGTGSSYVTLQVAQPGASGTADNAPVQIAKFGGPNNVAWFGSTFSTVNGWSAMVWGATNTTGGTGSDETAFGALTTAAGDQSTAMGVSTTASGTSSLALGQYAMAGNGTYSTTVGAYSVAMGLTNTSTANYPEITGSGDLGIFMRDQHNQVMSASNTVGVFGGQLIIDPASPATVFAAHAGLGLEVNGTIGASQYCDTNGANCIVPGSAGGTPAGAATQIQFNSSGAFGADPNLTWNGATGTLMSGNYDTTTAAGVYKINGTAVIMIPGVSADPSGQSTALGPGVLVSDNNSVGDAEGLGENGEYNTGVGNWALSSNTGGAENTAVGVGALSSNTTGDQNTAVGYITLSTNTTGVQNTAVGDYAGYGMTGSSNTLLGYAAGFEVSGDGNIILGEYGPISTGGSNILIGNYIYEITPTDDNQLDIGDTIFADLAAGDVGIGTATPTSALDVEADGASEPLVNVRATNVAGFSAIAFSDAANNYQGVIGWGNPAYPLAANTFALGTVSMYPLVLMTNSLARLTIDGSGNVGIGTTSPSSLFQVGAGGTTGKFIVDSQDSDSGLIQIGNPASDGETGINFISGVTAFGTGDSSTNGDTHIWSIGAGSWGIGGGNFAIANDNYGGPILTISSGGKVGIGTTTPQATLDVNGYLRLAKNSSQPVACSSTNDGAVALTHVYTLCLCKGASTSWVQSKDGATACSW